MKRLFVVALCAACLLGSVLQVSATALEIESPKLKAPRVPGEVVVRFDTNFAPSSRSAARAAVNGHRVTGLGPPGLELVELDGTNVPDAIAELERRPDVLYAEPNYVVTSMAVPNDPYFAHQWGLHDAANVDMDAPRAWNTTTGDRNVVVAVVDTGVAWDHPDLADNIWTNPGESGAKATNGSDDDGNGLIDDVHGWDWVNHDNDPMDVTGHGTHVAGTIAARGDNSRGITGVGWNTSVLPLRVLGASGAGGSADVAMAFWYAAGAGARVVNASFGTDSYSHAVSEAVAQNPDVLFVAAAGNAGTDNDQTAMWPCNLTHANVICVSAIGRDNAPAGFSNYGSTTVDIAAPGTSILSTVPNLRYPFSDTFEFDVESRWVTGGTSAWGQAPGANGLGYADSPAGYYGANANSWLATKTSVDVSGSNACALGYDLNMDTARPDAFYVEKSSDGTSWQRVAAYSGSTGGGWAEMTEDLGSVGSALYFRFRLVSDGSTSRDGVSIDNAVVRCAMSTYGNNYSYSSGTSMAAPHVSGAAALLFSASPGATASATKSALFKTVDAVPGLAGRIATSGRVNVGAAVEFMVGVPVEDPVVPPPGEVIPTPAETEPAPEPSQSPAPEPTVSPDPDPVVEILDHTRSLSTKIVRGPRLRGKLRADDAYGACVDGATVVIRRNGRVLKRVTTDATGSFRTKVPSARGRYRSIVRLSTPLEGHRCLKAVSFS